MDRSWNRNNGSSGGGGYNGSGEKMYRQHYSGGGGGHHNNQGNNYRKKNDYNGQDFYSKNTKPVAQPVKKESLQVALVEEELNSATFSWIKNSSL